MEIVKLNSNFDNLELELAITKPKKEVIGIIQISHGMSEHKERYYDFMKFLSNKGYVCVIHDHRGHGNSVKNNDDFGYFYTEDYNAIIQDLHQVTEYIKSEYKGLKVFLFSHSMGTLVARNYLKKYDNEIEKLILCGPPTKNNLAYIGLGLAKFLKVFEGEKERSKFLDKLVFAGFNKGKSKKNEWISMNPENVDKYNEDSKSGFIFTINGFINLLNLVINAFKTEEWEVNNTELPIFIIAGTDDPVIQSKKKFDELIEFLHSLGYININTKLYDNRRHELLNEIGKGEVYQDIYEFIKRVS